MTDPDRQSRARARILALGLWPGDVALAPLTGGLSNEGWIVTHAAGRHVVRFGADYPVHHVDRAREAMVSRAAAEAGFAPALIHAGPGVLVTRFLGARTLDAAAVRADLPRITALLRDFHTLMPAHVQGTATLFWPFHVIRDYARTLRAADSPFAPRLPEFLALSARLEAAQIPLPLVFGHNDLLPANLLDDGQRLWLVDYEYAAFSTALFDLAGLTSNAGCDEGETDAVLHAYFGQPPGPGLRRAMAAMQVASLLREAMWAMVSHHHLSAPGTDYAAYAEDNLARLETALDRAQTQHGRF